MQWLRTHSTSLVVFYTPCGKSWDIDCEIWKLTSHSAILEGGIFASHLIWMFRTRKIRRAAKADGKTFDDILREYEEQGIEFKFAERQRGGHPEQSATIESDVEVGKEERKLARAHPFNSPSTFVLQEYGTMLTSCLATKDPIEALL
jgi:hypothetical protein